MRSERIATKMQKVMGAAVLVVAVTCLAAANAIAQSEGTGSSAGLTQASTSGSSASPDSGGVTLAGQDMIDKAFIRRTVARGAISLQLGQMALDKSSSDVVKKIAALVMRDRSHLNDAFISLAKTMNLDLQQTPTKGQTGIVSSFEKLTGPDFDAAYLKFVLSYQKDMDDDFHREANYAANPKLKEIAAHASPILHTHRERLEQLAQVLTTAQK